MTKPIKLWMAATALMISAQASAADSLLSELRTFGEQIVPAFQS